MSTTTTPNLIVSESDDGQTLSKNFDGTITTRWNGVLEETNWAYGCVLSPNDSAKIKVKWQKRINDYEVNGQTYVGLRMGVVNDSGESVAYEVVLMVDQGDAATAEALSFRPITEISR